ncbi:hypothetical protein ACH5RR_030299 [Cinchona calisaya]|uniref:Receptor-like serine/threonine-protein kinase n=1 Tax=Cinchona calisaya TaxID=153742 RepID=A0ABD2YU94_9GENT
MAAVLIFFLFLSTFCLAKISAQQNHPNISLDSSLTPTGNSSAWLSRSGLFAFGFYKQGNGYVVGIFLAGIPQRTLVWIAKRDSPNFSSNVSLVLSSDRARLVLQQTGSPEVAIASPSERISSASMLDSGNFVLYNSDGRIIWQSFDYPTNTLLPSQRLGTGKELISSASETDDSTGIFRLSMQTDGNLVQYPIGTAPVASYSYWSSGTYGSGSNMTLNLEDDGYLYLINSSINILRNITEGGYPTHKIINLMKIDVDGIFRLYSISLDRGNQSIRWESTKNKCDPKGLCGLNGFCTRNDTVAYCKCIPGFDFVDQGNWRSGCERNFTAESCKTKGIGDKFTIMSEPGTVWEIESYKEFDAATEEDCANACLQDCNCEVAFFKDGRCGKQKLPLRFGIRSTTDSNIALVKVGVLNGSINEDKMPGNLPKSSKKEVRMDVLISGISLSIFGILILSIAVIFVYRNRKWAYTKLSPNIGVKFIEDVAPTAFTFAELEQATNEFNEEVGRGAFGTVYKGILPYSQKVVAVKRLERVLAEGEKEFQNEITVIGKTHHRNLVRLLGYCLDGIKRLLVYEYMCNGSLADVLFKPENHPCWDERIRIACDIARGILYLHEECETQIIHCDIKPQNILMDDNRCAKISDFGLAKLLNHDQTRTYTAVRGTRGYVAPEWHRKLPVTVKADVYSFGIVLLEIICCRKSVDWNTSEDQAILEEWAYDCYEAGEIHKLVGGDEVVDLRKLERMIKIAIWCIQDEPTLRPSMKKVLLMLEGTVEIPVPPCPTSFFSAV